MARRKLLFGASATMAALTIAAAAAPAQDARTATKAAVTKAAPSSTLALTEAESNEMIVADFLRRKERAEKAQRAILGDLRKDLDRRRAEFEAARSRFNDAQRRYSEIVGPLPTQGVFNPTDPRLPYEFEVRRNAVGGDDSRSDQLSRKPVGGGAVR